MINSYIFTGTGFVTGKYKISNDEIFSHVKKSYLKGFNEQRILASEGFQKQKTIQENMNAFDYMVELKMGFRNRYHVVPFPPAKISYKKAENTLSLAVKAIELALEDAGVAGKQIDAWFVGSATQDQFAPGIAEFVKAYFTDITDTRPTFSLTSACVGFNINIEHALAYFEDNPDVDHIVVAHSEVMSELLVEESDFVPFSTFGDSAAAVVISRIQTEKKCGLLSVSNAEDTAMLDFLGANNKGNLYMDARRVKSRAVPNISNIFLELLERCHWEKDEVDWFIPHQTGNAIVHNVRDIVGIDDTKLFQEVQYEHGNLSGASVPASIDILIKTGRLKPGQKVLTSVAGLGGEFGGFAYVVPEKAPKYMPIKELEGKIALITGSTGALGSKIAEFAAREGANLILHFNSNQKKAQELSDKLTASYDCKVSLIQADLSNSEKVNKLVEYVKTEFGKISYLINTHAITGGLGKASQVNLEEFVKVMNSNYHSIKMLCDGLLNCVTDTVLITGSVGEDAQFPGSASYVASKRSLRAYAINIASELYENRIDCVYYLPGLVDDGMISKLGNDQVIASMMMIDQEKLLNKDEIALRMLKSVYRLKIPKVRMSYESKLKVIKDGYLKY